MTSSGDNAGRNGPRWGHRPPAGESRTVGKGSYCVVGGGISGLTAAYRLRAATGDDTTITLFDPGDRLGGVLRTELVAGRPRRRRHGRAHQRRTRPPAELGTGQRSRGGRLGGRPVRRAGGGAVGGSAAGRGVRGLRGDDRAARSRPECGGGPRPRRRQLDRRGPAGFAAGHRSAPLICAAASRVTSASSVVVALAVPGDTAFRECSGVLVASGEQLRAKAITLSSRKWGLHGDVQFLRLSFGRFGD